MHARVHTPDDGRTMSTNLSEAAHSGRSVWRRAVPYGVVYATAYTTPEDAAYNTLFLLVIGRRHCDRTYDSRVRRLPSCCGKKTEDAILIRTVLIYAACAVRRRTVQNVE